MKERVLKSCSISKIGEEAWLDIDLPGMLFRLKMTPEELREFIDIGAMVYTQLINNEEPTRQ